MKVMVLGITGMLGNAVFRILSNCDFFEVYGTARSDLLKSSYPQMALGNVISEVNCEHWETVSETVDKVKPDVIVNCVGVVKQLASANDPLLTIPLNTLLPHRLAALCRQRSIRLIHISTDCVFSGTKGMYKETDIADARDLYGLSKLLGEVYTPESVTLRTSIIGHELAGSQSLVGWFLSQSGSVKGFARAIFSGLPTVELARIIRDIILPRSNMCGLYHVAGTPINKFELLKLIATKYGKKIGIERDDSFIIDRSLDASKFHLETGYSPPDWPHLIADMHEFG